MMSMATCLLSLALLFAAGSSENPIVDLCQEFTQKFNLLQHLVPLAIDVRLGRSSTSAFIKGHAVFKLGSDLYVTTSKPCRSTSTTTGKQIVLNLSASKSFIVTPTRVLTMLGNDFVLTLDVELSENGAMKKVTFRDFSISTRSIAEDSELISYSSKLLTERELKGELSDKLKDKLNGVFHRSKKVRLSHHTVYNLMNEVYLLVAQHF